MGGGLLICYRQSVAGVPDVCGWCLDIAGLFLVRAFLRASYASSSSSFGCLYLYRQTDIFVLVLAFPNGAGRLVIC